MTTDKELIDVLTKALGIPRAVLGLTPNYQHARDIPDETFLDAIRATRHEYKPGTMASGNDHGSATRWDVDMHLGGHRPADGFISDVPGVPAKVTLAKARRLIKRGLITGCACGCRGDYEITDGT